MSNINIFDAPCKNRTYDNGRDMSRLLCYIHEKTNVSYETMAKWIGVKETSFRLKMNKNRWTLQEIRVITELSGFTIRLCDSSGSDAEERMDEFLYYQNDNM